MYSLGKSGRWHNAKGHFATGAEVSSWLDRQAGREYLAESFQQDTSGKFRDSRGRFVSSRLAGKLSKMTFDDKPVYSPGEVARTFEYVAKPGAEFVFPTVSSVDKYSASFDMLDTNSQEIRSAGDKIASGDIVIDPLTEMLPSPEGFQFEISYTVGILHKKGYDYYEDSRLIVIDNESDPSKALGEAYKILFEGTKYEKYAQTYEASISDVTVEMLALG